MRISFAVIGGIFALSATPSLSAPIYGSAPAHALVAREPGFLPTGLLGNFLESAGMSAGASFLPDILDKVGLSKFFRRDAVDPDLTAEDVSKVKDIIAQLQALLPAGARRRDTTSTASTLSPAEIDEIKALIAQLQGVLPPSSDSDSDSDSSSTTATSSSASVLPTSSIADASTVSAADAGASPSTVTLVNSTSVVADTMAANTTVAVNTTVATNTTVAANTTAAASANASGNITAAAAAGVAAAAQVGPDEYFNEDEANAVVKFFQAANNATVLEDNTLVDPEVDFSDDEASSIVKFFALMANSTKNATAAPVDVNGTVALTKENLQDLASFFQTVHDNFSANQTVPTDIVDPDTGNTIALTAEDFQELADYFQAAHDGLPDGGTLSDDVDTDASASQKRALVARAPFSFSLLAKLGVSVAAMIGAGELSEKLLGPIFGVSS